MKKFINKMISSLLCVAMIISLLPIQVLAAEEILPEEDIVVEEVEIEEEVVIEEVSEEEESDVPEAEEEEADIEETEEEDLLESEELVSENKDALGETVTSGDCGESAVWSFADGTLTISGSGAIAQDGDSGQPWNDLRSEITAVVVEEGITDLGYFAFNGCSALKEVSLPDSLTSIGQYAFYNCDALETVILPFGKITEIGAGSFANCDLLQVIQLSYGVTTIGNSAFADCPYLCSVTIPVSVTAIAENAFDNTPSLEITYAGTVEQWAAYGVNKGAVCSDGTYTPAEDEGGSGGEGSYDSGWCGEDLYWELENGVLTFTADGSGSPCYEYEECGTPWYQYRDEIIGIDMQKGSIIGSNEFRGLHKVEWINLPQNLMYLQDSFSGCSALARFELPYGSDFGYSVSEDGTMLLREDFDEDGNELGTQTVYAVAPAAEGEIEVPDGVASILFNAFEDCTEVTAITLPDSLQFICDYAFSNCESLEEITIPAGIKVIGPYAFGGCTALKTITFAGAAPEIGTGAFADVNATAKYISADPNWDSVMGNYGGSITWEAEEAATEGQCGEDLYWSVKDGVLTFTTNGIGAPMFYQYSEGSAPWYVLRDSITSINMEAGGILGRNEFYGLYNVTHIDFHKDLMYFQSSFSGCSSLESFAFPDGSNCGYSVVNNGTTVLRENVDEDGNFVGTYALYAVAPATEGEYTVPDDVFEIFFHAFEGCGVTSVTIPDGVGLIIDGAFMDCENLEEINIPATVNGIGPNAFAGCSALTDVYYDGSKTDWMKLDIQSGNDALKNADIIYAVESAEVVASGSFFENPDVSWSLDEDGNLFISADGTDDGYMDSYVIPWEEYKEDVVSVFVGEGIYATGAGIFADHPNLREAYLPNSLNIIETATFVDCPSLEYIYIPENVKEIHPQAFSYCSSLQEIEVAQGNDYYYTDEGVLVSDEYNHVVACPVTKTGSYTVPEGIVGIDSSAFAESQLTELTLSGFVAYIDFEVFSGSAIEKLIIMEDVGSFGENCFRGCDNMTIYAHDGTAAMYEAEFNGIPFVSLGTPEVTVVDSGVLGDNINWSMNSVGVLTIDGEGAIPDCEFGDGTPWYQYGPYEVVIEEGITRVGACAFEYLNTVYKVHLPEGLEEIGDYAFSDCTKIREIELPESLKTIGDGAFGFTGLTSVHIPKNVSSIGQQALLRVENITVDEDNAYFTAADGVLFNKSMDTLLVFGKDLCKRYEIPETVTTIAPYAFAHSGIQNIDIPETVKTIGTFAFAWIYGLSIVLPEGLETIPKYLFCNSEIDSVEIPSTVTLIDQYAFNTGRIDKVIYAGTEEQWNNIEIVKESSDDNYGLDEAEIIFRPAPTFPVSGTSEHLTWTLDADGLLTVSGEGEMPNEYGEGAPWTEYARYIESLKIGEGITLVSNSAFVGLYNLKSVEFPSTLTHMQGYVFEGCSALETVHISENLTEIYGYAFPECDALMNFTVDANNRRYTAVDGVVYAENGTELAMFPVGRTGAFTVPEGVTRIGDSAFSHAKLSEIVLPDSVTTIYTNWLNSTDVKKVTIPASVTEIYDADEHEWIPDNLVIYGFTNSAAEAYAEKFGIDFVSIGVSEVEIIASGKLGSNITWKLDNMGTLTISGTGSMNDVDSGSGTWKAYMTKIKHVVIEEGITNIADKAFYGSMNITLQSVQLPSTLKEIGERAFGYCYALEIPELPEGLVTIGDGAFYGVDGSAGKILTIPASVEYVGVGAFTNADLEGFSIGEGDGHLSTHEGVLYSADMSTLLAYPGGRTDSTYTIPDGVKHIADQAFETAKVEKVILPDSMETIGEWAFSNGKLEEINFPEGLEAIGKYAFAYTYVREFALPASLTALAEGALSSFETESITVASGNTAYTAVGGVLFDKNMTTLLAYPALASAAAYTVPDGVLRIGDYAFFGNIDLVNVNLPDSLLTIGESAFEECRGLSNVVIPEGVTAIEDYAFLSAINLEMITLPDSLTSIGAYAFAFDTALRAITLPDGLTYLGDGAFAESGIMNIVIPNGVTAIYSDVFNYCPNLSCVTLPVSVTKIWDNAFYGCENLTDIYYGGTKAQWNAIDFDETNDYWLAKATIHYTEPVEFPLSGKCGDNLTWKLTETMKLTISGTGMMDHYLEESEAPWHDYREQIKEVVVSSGVTTIGAQAFSHFVNMTKITLPAGLTSIGNSSFNWCSSLKEIKIPATVTHIGTGAFSFCTSLETIVIPEGVPALRHATFESAKALKSITLPKSLEEIQMYVFSGAEALTDVYYGGTEAMWSEVTIGSGNDELQRATIHCSEIIGSGKCGTKANWELNVNGTLTISGSGAMTNYDVETDTYAPWYEYRDSITKIVIEKNITSVGAWAFSMCENVTSVTIPNTVKTIGKFAFQGTAALEAINIPTSVTKIQQSAFNGSGLKTVTVPGTVESLSGYAFAACQSLESVVLKSGVEVIGEGAFIACTGLKEVTIPASVTDIQKYVFSGCSDLKNIYFAGTSKQWKAVDVGDENSGLTYAVVHLKATSYDDHTFTMTVVAPSCIAEGYDLYTCTCGASYKENYTDMVEHNHITDAAVAPTCTETGLTEGEHCDMCDEVFVAQEIVDALGHAWDDGVITTAATTKAAAKKLFTCGVCGDTELRTLSISKPEPVSAVNSGMDVLFSWEAVEHDDVAGYRVYRKLSSAKNWEVLVDFTEDTECIDSTAVGGKKYVYTVSCMSANGLQISSYNTTGKTVTHVDQPEITEIVNDVNGLTIYWDKVAGASKYRVFLLNWYEDGDEYVFEKVADTSNTSYTYTKAEHDVEYCFTVAALDKNGKLVSTYNEAGFDKEFISVPEVTVTNDAASIVVEWTAVEHESVTKYAVLRKEAGGEWDVIEYLSVDEGLSYIDSDVVSGTKYAYAVVCATNDGVLLTAYDKNGVSVTHVAQPEVSLSNAANGVVVKWNKVAGASKYRVYLVTEADGEYTYKKLTDTTGTSYTYTKVENDETYSFTVAALDKKGKIVSAYTQGSEEIEFVSAPTLGTVKNLENSIVFSWNAVDNADVTDYVVMRKVGSGSWVRLEALELSYDEETGVYTVYDGDVESGKKYTYTVVATDGSNDLSGYNTTGKSITYVAQPEFALSNAANGVVVKWDKVAGASKYRVYLVTETDEGEYTYKKLSDTSGTSYTYTKAENGKTYSFTVAALDKSGKVVSSYDLDGESIEFVSAPTLGSVKNLENGVEFTWKEHSDAIGYEVFRKVGSGSWGYVGYTNQTSYIDEDVTSGVKYSYTVKAVTPTSESGYNTSGKSITYVAQPELNEPVNGAGGIALSWGKVEGASKYRVYQVTENADGDKTYKKLTDTSKLTYTYTKAKNDNEYTFTVAALDKSGKVVSSYDLDGKTIEFVSAPALDGVKNLQYGIEVSWNKVDNDDVQGYNVYRKTADSGWMFIAHVDADTLCIVDEDEALVGGTKYTYTVSATDAEHNDLSGITSGKTITRVEQPEIYECIPQTKGFKLTWNKVAGASKYRVYQVTLNDEGERVYKKLTDTSKLTYTFSAAKHNTTYTFTVAALDKSGKLVSTYNKENPLMTFLSAPTLVSAICVDGGVEFSWKEVKTEGDVLYGVYRKAAGETEWTMLDQVDTLVYFDDTVESGVKYSYTVDAFVPPVSDEDIVAISGYNTSGKSVTYYAQPKLEAVNGEDGIELSWEDVPGIYKYRIQLKNGTKWTTLTTTTGNSYTYTKAKEGQECTFIIRGMNKSGDYIGSYDVNGVTIARLETIDGKVLKVAFNQTITNPEAQTLQWISDELEARTEGRYKLEIYPDAQLGDQAQTLEQVTMGVLDMSLVANSVIETYASDFAILGTPYVYDSIEHQQRVFESGALADLYATTEQHGFSVLSAYSLGARNLYTRDGAVATPADLTGMKIRVMGSETCINMLNAMGGVGIAMAQSDVYSAIQTGTLDGAENNIITYVDLVQYEVAPYYNLSGHLMIPDQLVIANGVLESMSAEDQEILKTICAESIPYCFQKCADLRADYESVAEEKGVTFTECDVPAFQALCQSLIDDVASQSELSMDTYEAIRACAVNESTVELTVALSISDASAEGLALQQMSEDLYEATEGRYKLKLSHSGAEGSDVDAMSAITCGQLDMAVVSSSVIADNYVSDFAILETPFVFESLEHQKQALYSGAMDELFATTEEYGFKVLSGYSMGARGIFTSIAPIETPDDMIGYKYRIEDSQALIDMMTALGASATVMGLGDVYTGLQQGVIDGCEHDLATYLGGQYFTIAPYYTLTNHLMIPDLVVVSDAVLAEMSEDDQNALKAVCLDSTVNCFTTISEQEASMMDYLTEDCGVTITECDVDAFADACSEIIEEAVGYSELTQSTYEAIRACAVQPTAESMAVCLGTEPYSLDPALNSDLDSATIIQHMFSGLATWTQAGNGAQVIKADCAESLVEPVINSDGTATYTYTLKDGLTWSDGEALTAGDFEYAWKRAAASDTYADYGYMFDVIVGYPDNLAVTAKNDRTLEVVLSFDAPYWNELLAFPTYMPVREDVVADEYWATNPDTYVSNGMYTMTAWEESVITLTKNEDYHNADAVLMDELKFYLSDSADEMLTKFINGEWLMVDALPYGASSVLNSNEFMTVSELGTYYVNWNINRNLLPESSTLTGVEAERANAEIRNALSLLLNRKYICQDVTRNGELPASTFVAMGMLNADGTEFYKSANSTEDSFVGYYDVNDIEGNYTKAIEVLKKYYTFDEETGKFTDIPAVEYIYNESDQHKAIGEYMQAALAEVGMNVQLGEQEWATFMNTRKEGQYELARNGWVADYTDPICFLDMWLSASGNNDVQFGKDAHAELAMYDLDLTPWGIDYKVTNATWAETYDVLITEIKACEDAVDRCEMMHLAEDILMETGCLCPLYYYTDTYAINNSVNGLFCNPLGYKNFSRCTIDSAAA